jgi:hypothetical protein
MPLGEANPPGSIRRNQKSQLKTNRHADFPVLIPGQDRLLPGCRLHAQNEADRYKISPSIYGARYRAVKNATKSDFSCGVRTNPKRFS